MHISHIDLFLLLFLKQCALINILKFIPFLVDVGFPSHASGPPALCYICQTQVVILPLFL